MPQMTYTMNSATYGEISRLATNFCLEKSSQDQIASFISQLIKWQAKTNLISNQSIDEILTRHVADSLQLGAFMNKGSHWIDLGSGGGFPGIILGILSPVTCVENSSSSLSLDSLRCFSSKSE